jgi:predicted DNA-binding protein with PD1-like motif
VSKIDFYESINIRAGNMADMERIAASEFMAGRCLLGRLPHGKDLVAGVEEFCVDHCLEAAMFSIIGAVTSATLGAYDQKQQVYVTLQKREPLEIVHCTGNVSLKNGKPTVHAHGVFADIHCQTIGGHVFSETVVFAGEIYMQELLGTSMARIYDEQTGLFLWKA